LRKQGLKSYPAVLIGRLGVDIKYKHQNVGSQVLDFIKAWFIDENNKTGCRFLFVDAHNEPSVLSFYRKNGFSYLIDDEKTEARYVGIKEHEKLHTRKMFFDLIEIDNS
jgi:ribosomal protein S18 acetylase RimI-like enzyme